MLQNIKIMLFLFTLNMTVYTKGILPEFGKKAGCNLNVNELNHINTTVLNCENINFEKDQRALDNRFLRWGTLESKKESYIILFFSNGVHGERALVFNSQQNRAIEDIKSSWPIKLNKKKFQLTYTLDSDKQGEFPSHLYNFK